MRHTVREVFEYVGRHTVLVAPFCVKDGIGIEKERFRFLLAALPSQAVPQQARSVADEEFVLPGHFIERVAG